MSHPKQRTQDIVGAAVAAAVGGRAIRRDRNQGASVRDYDLVRADGREEPLEVTTATRKHVLNSQGRLRGADVEAPSLARTWTVDVPHHQLDEAGNPEAYDFRRFWPEAEQHLHALEALGRTRFDVQREYYGLPRSDPAKEILAKLLSLGVTIGLTCATPAGEASRIVVGMPVLSTGEGESLPDVLLREANNEGNRDKLRAVPAATKRHIVIRVEPEVGHAYLAVEHGRLGAPLPELPEPITTLWVTGANAMVHSIEPPGEWVSYRVPAEVFTNPERWVVNTP